MESRRTKTTTPHLLILILCLCATAAAQSLKEEFEPTAAQRAGAERLRNALAAAVGQSFEVADDRLVKRSDRHGGQLYWLAHLRARKSGDYRVEYSYRYKDREHPQDPLYDFVEHKTHVRVGERGCPRRTRDNFVCVGDTFILPVLFEDYTGHTFRLESQPYTPGNPEAEKGMRDAEDAALYREPVPNPAEAYLRYVGRRADYAALRAPGYTLNYEAVFEAVKPGNFNLSVGADPVPVIIVTPWTPVTILSARDEVRGYTERFSSGGGGTNYTTTPVILQVGERLTLQYHTYTHRGLSEGGEKRETLEATVKEHAPVITVKPFRVDPAQEFNEWVAEFLPPRMLRR
jgi:hypothetical protein